MERLLTIVVVTAVAIAVVGAVLYLTDSGHVDRHNAGTAGEPYSPGDPGGSTGAD